MRDKCLDLFRFNSEVAEKCSMFATNFFRTSALDSPNLLRRFQNAVKVTTNDSVDLAVLAVLSWYIEEETGWLLRLALEEKIGNNLDLDWIGLLLNSKAECLIYLQETNRWHTRDFFGNVLTDNRIKRLTKAVKPIFETQRRPKRVQRKRGYKDKGSLRKIHERHDFSEHTFEQNEIEQRRLSSSQTIQLARGWFFGG